VLDNKRKQIRSQRYAHSKETPLCQGDKLGIDAVGTESDFHRYAHCPLPRAPRPRFPPLEVPGP
jgi:hypothetical protein